MSTSTASVLPLAAHLCLCLLGVVAGFLDAPATALVAIVLAASLVIERSRCWLPGRLVLLWHYLNYIVAPVVDQGLAAPSWIFALTASTSFLAHAIYLLLPIRPGGADELLARLRETRLSTCLGLAILGGASMVYLISIGAFEQLAGKVSVDAPFKGLTGKWKTLLYPALAILALRWGGDRWSRWLALALLAVASAASLLSGRKEEIVLALGVFSLFFLAGLPRLSLRPAILLVGCAVLAYGSISFLYLVRRHQHFFSPSSDLPITTVVAEALEERNLVSGYRFSLWTRLNHFIQTERYLNRERPFFGPDEVTEMVETAFTPGLFKADPGDTGPTPAFSFGYQYGSAGYYGDSAVSAGPLVEAIEFLGWGGLLLVVVMPALLDRVLLLALRWPQAGIPIFWVVLLRALTYERFLLPFAVGIPTLVLPYLALTWLERVGLGRNRFFASALAGPPPPAA